MRTARIVAVACVALASAPLALAQDLSFFKSKAKPGLYEYKIQMDMSAIPGMPPGMGQQTHTVQHCLTQADIDKGTMTKRDPKENNDCEVKNVKSSGNTAAYTMACTKPRPMNADVKIAFANDGYQMDMTMNMAEPRSGQMMNMKQHMDAKYLGTCTK
ncbi:MAG TPA: DUF3617 domain-containing protein [Usitatibacter sp.]|jgi:hypothetical protein